VGRIQPGHLYDEGGISAPAPHPFWRLRVSDHQGVGLRGSARSHRRFGLFGEKRTALHIHSRRTRSGTCGVSLCHNLRHADSGSDGRKVETPRRHSHRESGTMGRGAIPVSIDVAGFSFPSSSAITTPECDAISFGAVEDQDSLRRSVATTWKGRRHVFTARITIVP
jgi:hypothetical protein